MGIQFNPNDKPIRIQILMNKSIVKLIFIDLLIH